MSGYGWGCRLYQRDELSLGFVVKKQFKDDGGEGLAFIKFPPETTIDSLHARIMEEIFECRSDKVDNSTAGMEKFTHLPRWLMRIVIFILHRLDFYGKNTLFMLFLTQIMIAADVLILPNYKTISAMNLSNTLIGTAMPFFASAMGTFLMRQTIKTIPYELEEAARIDGCNLFVMIIKIYLPLLVPCFIAHGLIAASYQWNNFLWPLITINSVNKRLLTVGLAIFAQQAEIGAAWTDTCAATFLTVAPLLIVFLFFQKRFIESFAHSGIK